MRVWMMCSRLLLPHLSPVQVETAKAVSASCADGRVFAAARNGAAARVRCFKVAQTVVSRT